MRGLILITSLCAVAPAWADAMPADRRQPPTLDCPAVDYDQLDFLLGEWVYRTSTRTAQEVRVTFVPLLKGCAILETRTPVSGREELALITFDMVDKQWHRHMVDHDGEVRRFAGRVSKGKIQFLAKDIGSHDFEHAIWTVTFEPVAGGKVRDYGFTSDDGGKTFAPNYDRILERAGP